MIETSKSAGSPFLLWEEKAQGTAESSLDPLSGDWTIFAPNRNQRPDDFKVTREVTSKPGGCPFCQGHESDTPAPVWVGRIDEDEARIQTPVAATHDIDQWSVRVVPNKFPAVTTTPCKNRGGGEREPDIFQSRPIGGGHEVIIESPQHVESFSELDHAEAALVFKAYQDRIRYWYTKPGIRYISIFKNVGRAAGASLRHCHSQLVAVDRQPKLVANIIDRVCRHTAKSGCCLQCDLIRAELKSKRRIVAQTKSLVAYCPFASRLPMLLRITTKDHQPQFEQLSPEVLEEVSRLALRAVKWLEQLHPGTAYNYIIHTCPPGTSGGADAFHWSLELFPRLTHVAGFEWSSQCMINPILPEVGAAKFRSCAAAEDPRIVL
jgi:UDPglucose--hexose-1-phosphate uridylyltransferase